MGERIVMLGAGAVGGYVGGHLALHGHDVTLIDFWHDNVEAIRKNGLELSGMTKEERQVSHPKTPHMHEVATLAKQAPGLKSASLRQHEMLADVAFGSIASILPRPAHVCLPPDSDQTADIAGGTVGGHRPFRQFGNVM